MAQFTFLFDDWTQFSQFHVCFQVLTLCDHEFVSTLMGSFLAKKTYFGIAKCSVCSQHTAESVFHLIA